MLVYKMEWLDIAKAFLTLGVYTTTVCYFFYRLNEKNINKAEDKMESSITRLEDKMERSITRLEDKIDKRIEDNNQHWREMFIYMNDRVTASQKSS